MGIDRIPGVGPQNSDIATAVVAEIPSSTPKYYTATTSQQYIAYDADPGVYLITCATSSISYVSFYNANGEYVTGGQTASGSLQLSLPSSATRLQFRSSVNNTVVSILYLGNYSSNAVGSLSVYTSSTSMTLNSGESMHVVAIGAGGGGGPGQGGGGGGGGSGFVSTTNTIITNPGNYVITVGSGGVAQPGGSSSPGGSGGSTTFGNILNAAGGNGGQVGGSNITNNGLGGNGAANGGKGNNAMNLGSNSGGSGGSFAISSRIFPPEYPGYVGGGGGAVNWSASNDGRPGGNGGSGLPGYSGGGSGGGVGNGFNDGGGNSGSSGGPGCGGGGCASSQNNKQSGAGGNGVVVVMRWTA